MIYEIKLEICNICGIDSSDQREFNHYWPLLQYTRKTVIILYYLLSEIRYIHRQPIQIPSRRLDIRWPFK